MSEEANGEKPKGMITTLVGQNSNIVLELSNQVAQSINILSALQHGKLAYLSMCRLNRNFDELIFRCANLLMCRLF